MSGRVVVLLGVLLAACTPSWATVRVERRADGALVIHNHGAVRPAVERPAAAEASADLTSVIEAGARRHALDPKLVDAVVRVESAYDPLAVSSKGAQGLMQLMPDTARELGVRDVFDPRQNVEGGSAYLRRMLDRFGADLELALAAYNAGPEAVAAFGGVPPYPETRRYVERVLSAYRGLPDYRLTRAAERTRPTFLYRDPSGKLVLTTTPPGRR